MDCLPSEALLMSTHIRQNTHLKTSSALTRQPLRNITSESHIMSPRYRIQLDIKQLSPANTKKKAHTITTYHFYH